MPIKVFLAEDNASLRKVVADLLREDQELSLIGQAETFAETLQQLELLPADVLLLDLHMPDERDFVLQFLNAQLAKRTPCVLAMSMSIDEEAKEKALALGAKVLMDKLNLYSELIPAIKRFHDS